MQKLACTVEQQLHLLQSRGIIIDNPQKAKEILLDVGYYRLGFYFFPFEKTYPQLTNRTHEYIEGVSFEDIVNLYYFDFDLRMLLMRYLNRIEIAFRTSIVYNISNKYKNDPTWFTNDKVVRRNYVQNFEHKVYTDDFRRNATISRHHQKNHNDCFAPAWKTLEFMTFGAVIKLYEQLKTPIDKMLIAQKFGIRQVVTFESYIHTVRHIRNVCAHGLVLYDLTLPKRIRKGPANLTPDEFGNIIGALRVLEYIMKQISANRAEEMVLSIRTLYNNLCKTSPALIQLIPNFASI